MVSSARPFAGIALVVLCTISLVNPQSQQNRLPPPTHGSLGQLVDGNYYTVRSFFSGGCLELCNSNLTDCSPPYMNANSMGQVWVNPLCTGGANQLWRTVPSRADNNVLTFFLVNKMQNFCLNRCQGGGCGYANNMIGFETCFLNSYNQAFYFNGSQIMFSRTDAQIPPQSCLTACFPSSTQGSCDFTAGNLITPFNTEAQACTNLATQQWFTA